MREGRRGGMDMAYGSSICWTVGDNATPGAFLDLLPVDFELLLAVREILPETPVAHQRLVTPLQSLAPRSHDRLPVVGILAGLLRVEAYHVTSALDMGLFDFQRRRGLLFRPSRIPARAPSSGGISQHS